MTTGMIIGVACLVVFAFIIGGKVGEVLAQLDALSEYAEAIHHNLITLIDLVRAPQPQPEQEQDQDSLKES